jgi:hypothetical protein
MVECPSISETIFGSTLRVSSSVAHVCRRSWKRICGSSARFRSGLKERRVRLWRLMGSPVSEANMRPFSLHREPTGGRRSAVAGSGAHPGRPVLAARARRGQRHGTDGARRRPQPLHRGAAAGRRIAPAPQGLGVSRDRWRREQPSRCAAGQGDARPSHPGLARAGK